MASVLIADDHPIVLSGVEALLREGGFELAGCLTSGPAMLKAAGGDVVLVDLNMPDVTGLDVLQDLRGRGDHRPVVLMASQISNQQLRAAMSLGVSGVWLKSSEPGQLLACIRQVLDGHRWMDPSLFDMAVAAREPVAADRIAALSEREQNIVRLVVQGLRNRDIGGRLGMTEGNVKVTLHRIYERLGVTNRVELAMMARDAMDGPPVAAPVLAMA